MDYIGRNVLKRFLDMGAEPITSKSPSKISKIFLKNPPVNNQIRARQVRVIDELGKNLGVLNLDVAINVARERNFDLVQVTEKVEPVVCKLMDYGKYLYSLQKKTKVKKTGGLKIIRLSFNISPHDMETRTRQAEKFLKEGDVVKVEMPLRGREKALGNFARGKFQQFLELLEKTMQIKVERPLKREGRGFTMIISRAG